MDYYLFGFNGFIWITTFLSSSVLLDLPLVFEFLLFQDTLHFLKLRFDGEKIKQTFDFTLCIWVLNSPLVKSWVTNPATRVRFPTRLGVLTERRDHYGPSRANVPAMGKNGADAPGYIS